MGFSYFGCFERARWLASPSRQTSSTEIDRAPKDFARRSASARILDAGAPDADELSLDVHLTRPYKNGFADVARQNRAVAPVHLRRRGAADRDLGDRVAGEDADRHLSERR